jgi:hypothetical protein
MAITITAKDRDAFYEEILTRFSGIAIIYRAAQDGELEKAQERGREYADLLLLVLNDLGWGEAAVRRDDFEVTTAPDVLRRSLNHLLGYAADQLALEKREQARTEAEMSGVQFIVDTCVGVLQKLNSETSAR